MEDSRIVELFRERDEAAVSEAESKYGAYCRSIAMNMLAVPGETETPLTRGVSLTGWAEWDGKLSVQIRYEDILETDDHGEVCLIGEDGSMKRCLYTVSVHDGADSLEDYVFDAAEAREGSLRGSFTTGGGLVKGDWQVTVPLE